jgi:hypothetical protein
MAFISTCDHFETHFSRHWKRKFHVPRRAKSVRVRLEESLQVSQKRKPGGEMRA